MGIIRGRVPDLHAAAATARSPLYPWLAFHALTLLLFAGFAGFVLLRRPPAPLWPVLFWVQISALIWAAGDLAAILSPDLFWKQASLVVLYAGSLSTPPVRWLLTLRFARAQGLPFAWARPWHERIPLQVALGLWLLLLTNPWHGQFVTPVLGDRQQVHWLWSAAVCIGQLEAWASLGAYLSLMRRHAPRSPGRGQAGVMLAASLAPLLGGIAYLLFEIPWPVEVNVISGFATVVLLLVGVYGLDLFGLSPVTLREIVASDDRAVLVVGRDGDLRLANRAAHRLLAEIGHAPPRPVPDALSSVLVRPERSGEPIGAIRLWRELRDLAEAGTGRVYQLQASRERWLLVTSARVGSSWRRRPVYCLRLQDVTGLREIEATRLRQERKLGRVEHLGSLGDFAAGLARELDNPLASILMSTRYAIEAAKQPQRARSVESALENVLVEASQARVTVQNVLRFAPHEIGDIKLCDLNQIIRGALDETAVLALTSEARLEARPSDGMLLVEANRVELELMLVNLIDNAIRSRRSGANVRVSSELDGECALITVRDDGPGIHADLLPRIFDPFFSTRGAGGGSGLGLSIAHGIVESHGGTIEVEGLAGAGTEFRVRLPVTQPPA